MFTPILKSVELGSIISSSSGSSFSSISSISSIFSIAHHSHRDMNLDMDLDTRFDMNLDTNLHNILSQTQSLVERHPLAPLPSEVGSHRVIFLTRPCSVPKWKNVNRANRSFCSMKSFIWESFFSFILVLNKGGPVKRSHCISNLIIP